MVMHLTISFDTLINTLIHNQSAYDRLLSSFDWTSGRFPCLAPFENRIDHAAIIKFYFYWYPIE
jgi:hypothetical protein